MNKIKLVCYVGLLMAFADNSQAEFLVVPIPKTTAIADMICPTGESVVGFSAGVPLCSSDVTSRIVFVTSTTVTGAIGGLKAADAICQEEAEEAGLSGNYIAFLGNSAESDSTIERVEINPANLPYVRPDGVVVANNLAAFLSLSHSAPINTMAAGSVISGDTRVWTGYKAGGEFVVPDATCLVWTDATPWTQFASNGDATVASEGWLKSSGTYCTESHHLYCVQVPLAVSR